MPVIITTNGTQFRKEIVDLFEKYENLVVQFSLDGSKPSTHESQNDKDTFVHVINAIHSLDNVSKNQKIIRMTISKPNYKEAVEVARIAEHHNCGVNYSYVCRAGRAVDNWDMLEMSLAQMTVVNEELRRYAVLHSGEEILPPKSIQSCPFEDLDYVFGLNIDPRGNVNVCTCLVVEYIAGKAYEQSLSSIINSPIVEALTRKVTLRKTELRNITCTDCRALQRCQQGYIGRAARNGDEMGVDDQCDYRRALQFKILFLFAEKQLKADGRLISGV